MSIESFLSSFDWDHRIFEADIKVGKAHSIMLHRQGIIKEKEASKIVKALNEIEKEGFKSLEKGYEDIHPSIEKKVIEKTGEKTGGKLHTARSRNDEVATCIRMSLRKDMLELLNNLLKMRQSLIKKAETTKDWLVSGYTHLQRAQPTTMGHWLLSYERVFKRDTDRVLDCYKRVNCCPLGSAALAGTGFPIDREFTADILGFNSPTRNSMDGVANRDFAVEAVSCTATTATNLSRLSEDIILWNTKEFGFIELNEVYASSSSIMPQKKNPDTAELSRGKSSSVQSSLTGILTLLKGLPMSYNRDLQEATHHIWRAFDKTIGSLNNLADTIETAQFNRKKMEESISEETGATEVADLLVRKGIPFRIAYEIVSKIVKNGDLSIEKIKEKTAKKGFDIDLKEEEFKKSLDPKHGVEIRDSLGGPGELEKAIEDIKKQFKENKKEINSLKEKLERSERKFKNIEENITK